MASWRLEEWGGADRGLWPTKRTGGSCAPSGLCRGAHPGAVALAHMGTCPGTNWHLRFCRTASPHWSTQPPRSARGLGGWGLHGGRDSTEWGKLKTRGWLLCWVLPPLGRGGECSPACPSEPSFSFPLLELLGSGCPVCVKTQKDYQAFRFSRSLFPSGSTAVQLCIRVSQPFVLGRCLGLFNSGVGGLQIKGLFTRIFLISVDWGGGRYLVLGSYKLYPKAKSKC